jgi:hypothetical protein
MFHLATPSPINPLGVKGAGEAGTIPVTAAVAGAVEDALRPFGVRVTRMPLNPARISDLIRGARRFVDTLEWRRRDHEWFTRQTLGRRADEREWASHGGRDPVSPGPSGDRR